MLTVEELSHLLEPATFDDPFGEGVVNTTWRYQWGPITFLLEELEDIDRRHRYEGTVEVLGSSVQFRATARVTSWRRAKTHVLEKMVDHVRKMNPRALREVSDFLWNAEAGPVGKSALERVSGD